MTLSEDEMFDNEDDSSEDEKRNDRPTDSNNSIPKESPLPSPKSLATCSRPNISTAINKSVMPSRFDSSSPGGNGVLLIYSYILKRVKTRFQKTKFKTSYITFTYHNIKIKGLEQP